MKLFADECIYQNTVDLLRKSGFEVITVQEAGLAGYSNGEEIPALINTDP